MGYTPRNIHVFRSRFNSGALSSSSSSSSSWSQSSYERRRRRSRRRKGEGHRFTNDENKKVISHPHASSGRCDANPPKPSVHFLRVPSAKLTIAAIFDAIVPDRRSGDGGDNCRGIAAPPRRRRQRRSGPSSPPPIPPTTMIIIGGGRGGGRRKAATPEVGGSVENSAAAATAAEIIAVVDNIVIVCFLAPARPAPLGRCLQLTRKLPIYLPALTYPRGRKKRTIPILLVHQPTAHHYEVSGIRHLRGEISRSPLLGIQDGRRR